jgi:hypothetical protein
MLGFKRFATVAITISGIALADFGFELVAEKSYKVFFRDVEIGELDVEALRIRPLQSGGYFPLPKWRAERGCHFRVCR